MKRATNCWVAAALVFLAGCSANHHSIYRHQAVGLPSITTIDAKQRVVLAAAPLSNSTVGIPRFCAEPSPDVFAVIAQAVSGGASFGQSGDPKTIQAALNAAFSSSEQGATIPRTQTTNLLRELMYRTCERYLSGGIGDVELSVQAVRDQRLIVSILAIEQLTGAVTSKPVVIGASANASSGASGADAAIRLDDQYKAVQETIDALKKKQTAYDGLDGTGKECDSIAKAVKDKKEDGLSQALKDKRPKCEAASAELSAAKKEKATAEEHYTKLASVASSGGIPVVVGGSLMVPVAGGGLDGGQSSEIAHVAEAVKQIVASTFNQDEYLFFCLKVAQDATGKLENVRPHCIDYINSQVEVARQRNETTAAEIEAARAGLQIRSSGLFDQFWSLVSKNDQVDPVKLASVRQDIKTADWPKCFDNAKTKVAYQTCFNSSVAQVKRDLAKGSS